MNVKRFIVAAIALFGFIFFYEWLVHSYLLLDVYQNTEKVWRNLGTLISEIPLTVCFQLSLAFWSAYAFTQIYPKGGVANGLLLGLYFGVFAGILTSSWYLWLPVPAILGFSWFVSSVLEGIVGGLILGAIYRNNSDL